MVLCARFGDSRTNSTGKRSPLKATGGMLTDSMRIAGCGRPASGTTSMATPSSFACHAARAAEPVFSRPSDSSNTRGTRFSGSPASPSRIADSRPVPRPASLAVFFKAQPLAVSEASSGRVERANGMTRITLRPLAFCIAFR